MKPRLVTTQDIETVKEWWSTRFNLATGPLEEYLSETGVIIDDVAALWLYPTNSKIMLVGWPISNPKAGGAERRKALQMLLAEAEKVAKASGYTYLFSMVANDKFTPIAESQAWVNTGDTAPHLIKAVS